jgi:hypothetical protein
MPFKIGSPFVAPLRRVIPEAEKYLAEIFLCRDSKSLTPRMACVTDVMFKVEIQPQSRIKKEMYQ